MSTEELLKERGQVYGSIENNIRCKRELMEVFKKYMNENSCMMPWAGRHDDHLGVMELVFHKLARIATGQIHEDNYKDACGYIELARKVAMGEPTNG